MIFSQEFLLIFFLQPYVGQNRFLNFPVILATEKFLFISDIISHSPKQNRVMSCREPSLLLTPGRSPERRYTWIHACCWSADTQINGRISKANSAVRRIKWDIVTIVD